MSDFQTTRPRYALPFAGKDYELLGTFGMIEAVEYAMKEHIGRVAVQIVNGMPAYDLAKVIAALLTGCGHKVTAQEAGDLLWNEVGLSGDANDTLRLHLYAFLSICLAPPGQREKKAQDLGELLGKLNRPEVSPGASTAGSV